MRDELKDKIETWVYGLAVGGWALYAFLAGVVKVKMLAQVSPLDRIEWGMIVVAAILYMLLRKVLNLKRQSRVVETFDTFASGVNTILVANPGASLDIFALSTQTFLHHIAYRKSLQFGRVRVLMPTESALRAFYTQHHLIMGVNPETAVSTIKAQIEESIRMWEGLRKTGQISDLAIRRVELFPTNYIVVISEEAAFTGHYFLDGLTTHHGLSLAETYVFSGKHSPAPQSKRWFESIWKAVN